jgi:thioredoxin reductase (NADPH)
MTENTYELVIVGSGPAGLTAAVYAARYKLNTLILGKEFGGVAATAHKICNFPTYDEISGIEFMEKMEDQVRKFEIQIEYDPVTNIESKEDHFVVSTENDQILEAQKIIIALGTERRKLDIPGEQKFGGKGVSYCATCDGAFFINETVAVIGGSNAALTAALLLAERSRKVYIIYRKHHFFRAEPVWVELVEKNTKIESIFNAQLTEIKGGTSVERAVLQSGDEIILSGVFIEIGSVPDNALLKKLKVEIDAKGYIVTDKSQKTNISGIYAAGDITNNILKQDIMKKKQETGNY